MYNAIKEIVYKFPSRHKEGILQKELLELLTQFPNVDISKFNDAMDCLTVIYIDNQMLIYKHDIINAIYSGSKNNSDNK